MTARSKGTMAALIVVVVLILDQILKFYVKTHFFLGENVEVTPWFYIYFIENNGMAFGMEMGSKLFLTLFRIVAVAALVVYIILLLKRTGHSVKTGYIACLALITAGAAGNIFDCVFYGVLFNNPAPPQVAQLLPAAGGYAPLFHGKVVDMLYFPLVAFDWPDWMPVVGGEHFVFFQPVFNLADAAISVGIILLLIGYARCMTLPRPPHTEPLGQ